MRRRSPEASRTHNADRTRSTMPRWTVWLAAVGVLIVVAGGALYAADQERTIRQGSESALSTIAQLKADEVADWRADRILDGERTLHSPSASDLVAGWIEQPRDADDAEIMAWLRANTFGDRYEAATLADLDGTVLVSTIGMEGSLDPSAFEGAKVAVSESAGRAHQRASGPRAARPSCRCGRSDTAASHRHAYCHPGASCKHPRQPSAACRGLDPHPATPPSCCSSSGTGRMP